MNPGMGLARIRELLQRLVAPIDPTLMMIAGLLVLLAFGMMGSASPERITAQLVNVGVALVVMRIVAQIPPQRLMHLAVPIYLAGVLLLIAVALFGDVSKGARRWLNLGFMRVQPSELMKIAMPLLLAWYFQQREAMPRLRDYGIAAVLLLLPVGLIARQPDLGTAILVMAAGFYVIFFAGLSWKIIVGMAAAAIAAAPLAWNLLHDYQRNRIITLFDPEKDPLGKGFHIIQSTIAIGSGGIFGKGWREGTQAQLEFIPERHTDFIFAVFSEEFGLVGNSLLLADGSSGRVFVVPQFAPGVERGRRMRVFDIAMLALVHDIDLPYACVELHRWGDDGLACRTPSTLEFSRSVPLVRQ